MSEVLGKPGQGGGAVEKSLHERIEALENHAGSAGEKTIHSLADRVSTLEERVAVLAKKIGGH